MSDTLDLPRTAAEIRPLPIHPGDALTASLSATTAASTLITVAQGDGEFPDESLDDIVRALAEAAHTVLSWIRAPDDADGQLLAAIARYL